MKKTLFLALLSIPLVFTACAKNKTPAATSTVITTASQAVVEAPANVKGKTIVFDYTNAKERSKDTNTNKWGGWTASNEGINKFEYFTDLASTRIDNKGRTVVSGCEGDYVFYTKTSSSTAKVQLHGSTGGLTYTLKFLTPTTGVATMLSTECEVDSSEAINIAFSIQ